MPSSPLQTANNTWGSATLINASGNPLRPPTPPHPPANTGGPSGPSGGHEPMIEIAGLKKNVGFLNWATGLIFLSGLAAILASYLMLAQKIEDRYDRIGDKIEGVSQQIGDMRVQLTEAKANGNSQGSDRAK